MPLRISSIGVLAATCRKSLVTNFHRIGDGSYVVTFPLCEADENKSWNCLRVPKFLKTMRPIVCTQHELTTFKLSDMTLFSKSSNEKTVLMMMTAKNYCETDTTRLRHNRSSEHLHFISDGQFHGIYQTDCEWMICLWSYVFDSFVFYIAVNLFNNYHRK